MLSVLMGPDMIEVFFVACLLTSPDDCQPRSMVFAEGTQRTCMMQAQPELAKWAAEHPAYTIKSWKCRPVNPYERET